MIFYSNFELNSFVKSSFVHDCTLFSFFKQLHVKILLNINVIDYSFIDENIARIVCDKFDIKLVALQKFKFLKNFNDRMIELITYVIYFNFILQNHIESLASMFIIKLKNHQFILNKF